MNRERERDAVLGEVLIVTCSFLKASFSLPLSPLVLIHMNMCVDLMQAPPPPDLVSRLDELSRLTATYVAIVSGRDKRTLMEWFEDAPNVILAAEHGIACSELVH